MRILFGQLVQDQVVPQAGEQVVTVDWIGLLLTLGLCVCPVILLIAAIIAAIVISKRKPKPPE